MSVFSEDKACLFLTILENVERYIVALQEQGITELECFRAYNSDAGESGIGVRVEDGKPDSDIMSSNLKKIEHQIAECSKCRLHDSRSKVVPGQGSGHPEIMFVGEGPGREEDRQGLAFVGAAGRLLTRIIEAMGYKRDEVFIANVVKCRPPDNRKPLPDEMNACLPYLKAQISFLRPKVIVTLGATALEGLIGPPVSISKQRGLWLNFEGIPLMPTFHPSYLLRTPSAKKHVWEDMKSVLKQLGRTPPKPH